MFTIKAYNPSGGVSIYEAISVQLNKPEGMVTYTSSPSNGEATIECIMVGYDPFNHFSSAYIENQNGKTIESLKLSDVRVYCTASHLLNALFKESPSLEAAWANMINEDRNIFKDYLENSLLSGWTPLKSFKDAMEISKPITSWWNSLPTASSAAKIDDLLNALGEGR